MVVSPKKQVFMVMEYMEHDFRSLMENMHRPFRTSEVKCLMHQLLSGTEFMHRHWVRVPVLGWWRHAALAALVMARVGVCGASQL